jgi:hypothetical protein
MLLPGKPLPAQRDKAMQVKELGTVVRGGRITLNRLLLANLTTPLL